MRCLNCRPGGSNGAPSSGVDFVGIDVAMRLERRWRDMFGMGARRQEGDVRTKRICCALDARAVALPWRLFRSGIGYSHHVEYWKPRPYS